MAMFFKKKKKFKCSQCGQHHDEYPALTYTSPTQYHNLSENDKKNLGKLKSDSCIIEHEDQTDRFIRVVLNQEIINSNQILQYGLWVSLSEKSFTDYIDNFNNSNHITKYFGWLCSQLPYYEEMLSIPTTVVTKSGTERPEIFPHDDFDHQFVEDYYNGITKIEAEKRIHEMLSF